MTIYQVSYLSDTYMVKGFLGLPESYTLSESSWNCCFQLDGVLGKLPSVAPMDEDQPNQAQTRRPIAGRTFPALIYCRGGIGKVGMVKLDWVRLFASFGFVVFAPAYRGNMGGEGRDQFGGDDREDVHSAVRLLQKLPFVQADRISVLGFSRGAINAALTAVEVPGIHRLVSWGGVSNLAETYEERIDLRRMLKRVIGGTPHKVPEAYCNRSPLHLAEKIGCPVLIVHGTKDVQVDISHGDRLYQKLRSLQKSVDYFRLSGYGHHLPSPVHEAAVERMLDWLRLSHVGANSFLPPSVLYFQGME